VHAANKHESQWAFEFVEQADQESDRLEVVFADKAYRGDLEDELAETLGVQLEIPESESDTPGFAAEPKRWTIERTFGWFGGWRRLSIEYERLTETSEAIIRLALLELALNRLQFKSKHQPVRRLRRTVGLHLGEGPGSGVHGPGGPP
jgi:putative transposase